MSGALVTLKRLIKSNLNLKESIKENEEITIDSYLRIELSILYLKVNSFYASNLNLEQQKIINDILSGKFTIIEDKIVTPEKVINLKELRRIILEIERNKYNTRSMVISIISQPNTIRFSEKPQETKSDNIIRFPVKTIDFKQRLKEAKKVFSTTMEITKETRGYVHSVASKYNSEMTKTILATLNGNISRLDQLDIDLLVAHLSVYPLQYDLDNKLGYVDQFIFPQSSIGVSRMRYVDEFINEQSRHIKDLYWRIEHIKEQISYNQYIGVDREGDRYHKLLDSYQNEYINQRFSYYTKTQSSTIYNHNLIQNIDRAIRENHVDLNQTYIDPIITFFAMDYSGKKADFHCSMHLSTFSNLITQESLEKIGTLTKK